MEKDKEDVSCITTPISNPSIQDISRPLYLNFSNYMSSYYGPVPHAWLPPFVPPPSASLYPWSNQQHSWSSTFAATSSTTALSSFATLYSSAIPMIGPPPTAYPYPWSNQQHSWNSTFAAMDASAAMPTSAPMSSFTTSVSSSVVASSSVQTSASVATSSCSTLPAFVSPTSTNPYQCGSEEIKVQQSNSVEEISEATLDSIEIEMQSTGSLGNTVDTKEACSSGSLYMEPTDGVISLRSQNSFIWILTFF